MGGQPLLRIGTEEDDFRNNGGVMNHEMVDGISKRKKPLTC